MARPKAASPTTDLTKNIFGLCVDEGERSGEGHTDDTDPAPAHLSRDAQLQRDHRKRQDPADRDGPPDAAEALADVEPDQRDEPVDRAFQRADENRSDTPASPEVGRMAVTT